MTDTITLNMGGLNVTASVHELFTANFDLHFTTFYNRRADSLLNQLCDKYGSDKGEIASEGHPYPWPSHTYADYIERCFGHCREHVRNVFECGLGTNNPKLKSTMGPAGQPGASLRVWRDYFPNALIFGADIDRTILFQEERIATHYCDQTSREDIAALWAANPEVQFDLMIDDGLHTYQAGLTLFQNSIDRLKDGGFYVIEDVSVHTLMSFAMFFKQTNYNVEFVNLYRKGVPLGDNSLIVVRK